MRYAFGAAVIGSTASPVRPVDRYTESIVAGVLVVGSLQQLGVTTQALLTVGGLICLLGVALVGPVVRRAAAEIAPAARPS